MTCYHHWTVTSECPKCLRAEVKRVRRDCLHEHRVKVGVVGNLWCYECGAISKPIAFGREPLADDWTLPERRKPPGETISGPGQARGRGMNPWSELLAFAVKGMLRKICR